jgi:tRNA(Ile)-lysidine synthase
MEGAGEAFLAIAREAASFRVDVGGRAAALIDRHITMPSPGVAFVGQAFKDDSDGEAKVHALGALLAVIGGSRHFPDPERVARLFEPKRGRATLSRTVVDHRKAGMFVYREGRNLPTSAPISGRMLWDGRFRLEAAGADHLSVIAGAILAEESPKRMPVPDSVRRAGLAARPVFVAASGNPVEARPGMIVPLLAPWARFLSCLDLDLARSLARLVAAPEIPPPPLAGHNEREG